MSIGHDGAGHASSAPDLLPHGVCYLWDPRLIYMHVTSDVVIALSYFSIPLVLMIVSRRRPDLIPPWVLHLFSAFILCCGLTHLMGIWTLWNPDFLAQGLLKTVTATVSAITAIGLWSLLPKLLTAPSHEQLAEINRELKAEVLGRRETEAKAERERKFMEAVLDNIKDAIVACDANGKLTFFNRATQQAHGLPAESLPAERWAEHYDLFHADGRTPLEVDEIPLFRALSGKIVEDAEMMISPKNGEPISMLANGRAMYSDDGTKLGAVVSMFDITERKKSEQALAESQEQLRQAQKVEALGQLTGGIAHDFNNLLTVVMGNLQLIKRRVNADWRLTERVDSAIASSERGAELTGRLLAFARRQVLAPEVVDLNQLIPNVHVLLDRGLDGSVDLRFAYAEDLWRVSVDSAQLESSVFNLVLNARDALPNGGTIVVETRNLTVSAAGRETHEDIPAGDYVMLTVSDDGVGMTAEVQERIFEPFFSTKKAGQGTGLGLSMVYGFVHQSGGHISARSEVDRGTVMSIYLPRSNEALAVKSDRTDVPVDAAPENKTILVVEDDDGVRDVAVTVLGDLGYRVLSANGGPQAIEIAEKEPNIDLLFSDVVMPFGMNGPDVAKKLSARIPGMKVLFVSGYTANALTDNGELPGSTDLLSKPYSNERLASKVAEIFSR